MASKQQFCLRWNNHQSTLISVFDHLLESGTLVDCTLAAEGQFLKAHKVVLSACSPYLEAILSQHYEKHPILILKDVSFNELKSLLDYMYRGEVNISQEQLGFFLKVAESLQVKGLTDSGVLNDSKEVDCSRNSREFARIDRVSSGVLKRNDIRKHSTLGSFAPLAELPPNQLLSTLNHQKDDSSLSQEINAGYSDLSCHNKEDSLSPASKRKRVSSRVFNNEQITAPNENHERDSFESSSLKKKVPPSLDKVVLSNTQTTNQSLPENDSPSLASNESAAAQNSVEDNIETKVKSEIVDFSDVVKSEESVDIEEDLEEEGEDEDLSRPGPSSESNSHVAGIPWHIAGDGNGEDLLLANQQDSQGESFDVFETEMDLDTYCKECGSDTLLYGILKHEDSCLFSKKYSIVRKEELVDHKKTLDAEDMPNQIQPAPSQTMLYNNNTLCTECGSIIMHNGVILHTNHCSLAKDRTENNKKKYVDVGASVRKKQLPPPLLAKNVQNKTNPLCRQCGSTSICNGLVLHLESCKMADDSYGSLKKKFAKDTILNKKKNISSIVRKDKQNKRKHCQPHTNDKENDTIGHDKECNCNKCLELTKRFTEMATRMSKYLKHYHHAATIGGLWMCNCGKIAESKHGLLQHMKFCCLRQPVNNPSSSIVDTASTLKTDDDILTSQHEPNVETALKNKNSCETTSSFPCHPTNSSMVDNSSNESTMRTPCLRGLSSVTKIWRQKASVCSIAGCCDKSPKNVLKSSLMKKS